MGEYEGTWIIQEAEYRDLDVTEYLSKNQIVVKSGKGGMVPSLKYKFFEDKTFHFETEFKFVSKKKIDYILMSGSLFFTGEFKITCIDENCCKISLENEDKRLVLSFDEELEGTKERNCPPPNEVLTDFLNF